MRFIYLPILSKIIQEILDKTLTNMLLTILWYFYTDYIFFQPPLPNSVQEVIEPLSEEVSSSEEVFDTPKEIVLRKKLRRECLARTKLIKKIKKVQQENYYLKKKCDAFKMIIQNFKEKYDLE